MKPIIPILFLMMIVGCGQSDVERLEEENRRMKAELENRKLKSNLEAENKKLKEDLLKLSFVGSYEGSRRLHGGTEMACKLVLLENGRSESYLNDLHGLSGEETGKNYDGTWKMVGKEVVVVIEKNYFEGHRMSEVYKIEPNGDLTDIARIEKGKRKELPKDKQETFIKLK